MARRRIGPRAVVLVGIGALVSLEIGLRTFGSFRNQTQSESDAELGYRLLPEQSFRTARGTEVRTNSAGFRDGAWTQSSSAADIAVLGDSVAFGQDVDERALWCRVLERSVRLSSAPSTPAYVVRNYAVPGYTLEQMARLWETSVRAHRPNIVIVCLAPYSIRPMRERSDPARVPLRRFLQRTATYELAERWWRRLDRANAPEEVLRAELDLRADPFASENRVWWDRALARLDALQRDVAANGGRLVLVATPIVEHVVAPPADSPFAVWASSVPGVAWIDPAEDLRRAMQPLLVALRESGTPWTRVWNRFERDESWQRFADSSAFFFDDPWHLTELGHRVVGATIARELGL
ncbi:MAG: SGNH/GDSL hydrolase family protein [Planctomycetota bacterium]